MSSKLYNVNGDLKCWIDLCSKSEIRKFIEASNTIENWLDYIANSFIDKRLSNGFTEKLNNKIEMIKIVGLDIKILSFFRLIILYILKSKDSKKALSSKNSKLAKLKILKKLSSEGIKSGIIKI